MTKRQLIERIVAAELCEYAIECAMGEMEEKDPPWDDWDSFYGHLSLLYHAPLHQRRYLLRQTCRAFDIPIDPSLDERPALEQLVMF